jgi:serine/threonine protein kinase
MDKGTLKGYLDRSEFFEETDALFIFKQIVLGLKEYHEN